MATVQPNLSSIESTTPIVPAPPVDHQQAVGEHRFSIRNIDWAAYKQVADALVDRNYYMSYDGEDLELMTVSDDHEQFKGFLGDFVVVLSEETGQPRRRTGAMTMRREDLERAIEADESFYIVNEPKVRHQKIDLKKHPPPDLGIEIDLTTDSRRRLGIYSQIAVPEIWRYNGRNVTIYQRQSDGDYQLAERSKYFPFLSAADLDRFLQQRDQLDESALLLSFRKWVREQVAKQS